MTAGPVGGTGIPDPAAQISGLVFAFLLIDGDGIIRQANQAAEDLLGMGAARIIGRNFTDVMPLSDTRIASRLRDPEARLTARGLPLARGDTTLTVNLTLSPVASSDGWRVVTLSDAGQASMEDDPEPAGIAAPAVLAHEIKNPLAAIRGAGQLLARKLPERERELATLITEEVDRIARMIDRMQALGSTQEDPLTPVNLHEAIRNALGVVRSIEGAPPVTFKEEFDPSLPLVMASRDALQQVLINLLSNARDACSENEDPIVKIRTRYVTGLVMNVLRRGRGRSVALPIEVSITDNGPGIDPAIADRIFEPFVTSKQGGQGLGLALVRKLVRDMDGRIAHERDRRAEITRFSVHLAEMKEPI
ncbi:nitrogen regulation protein NR(II) [Qipengyuania sp. DSG2-2]|uniref:two-component system sensor histidine kinase NtrB n=1 Tax=Qipengyuania sp. DGS2-2 TaxID=3349631 RepID=UPI0036D42534